VLEGRQKSGARGKRRYRHWALITSHSSHRVMLPVCLAVGRMPLRGCMAAWPRLSPKSCRGTTIASTEVLCAVHCVNSESATSACSTAERLGSELDLKRRVSGRVSGQVYLLDGEVSTPFTEHVVPLEPGVGVKERVG